MLPTDKVQYDFFHRQTKHHLVQKYFSLRSKCYIDQWNLKHFAGEYDEYDDDAIILIAHKNNICVGGARLIIHDIGSSQKLPIETDEFQMKNLFPELELDKNKYAELSRMALLKEYRNGQYSSEIYRMLIKVKAASLNIKYIFGTSVVELARASRINFKRIGLPFEIKTEIEVPALPTYEGNKMALSLIDLTKMNSTEYQEERKVKDLVC